MYVSGHGPADVGRVAPGVPGVQKISRAFFSASEVFVGPRIFSKRRSVEVWISLTMPVPTTTVPACTCGASRYSWSSSSARLLGTRTSRTSIRSGGGSWVVSRVTVDLDVPMPARSRFAAVAARVRAESVTCVGWYAASAVVSVPQRSPSTTIRPAAARSTGPRSPVPESRWRSRYSSAASQARSRSRGSSGKRVSS